MMKGWVVAFAAMLLVGGAAQAGWVELSKGLAESDVLALAADPLNEQVLFAGTSRAVYKSQDGGQNWKKILALKGESKGAVAIQVKGNAGQASIIYVASGKELRWSEDGGKNWRSAATVLGEMSRIQCLASGTEEVELWVGTDKGLAVLDKNRQGLRRISDFPAVSVESIFCEQGLVTSIQVATHEGIYTSVDGGLRWAKTLPRTRKDSEGAMDAAQQFGVEESIASLTPARLAVGPEGVNWLTTDRGVFEDATGGGRWSLADGQNVSAGQIRDIVAGADVVYLGTERGVWARHKNSEHFTNVSEGLGSRDLHDLVLLRSGQLLAATARGIYRSDPMTIVLPQLMTADRNKEIGQVLAQFDGEPTIRQVQDAAIRYAEVHPDKIKAWREAASKKAILPTVSLGGGMDVDENIDLDRGGTNDPDRFIMGPEEHSLDWSVTLNWNLGELIWNDDQTTIDTRSKLMVEMRGDILSEVTHLYYERRRLQVELAMTPPAGAQEIAQRSLRLEELTAQIDGLTGGYFTGQLQQK